MPSIARSGEPAGRRPVINSAFYLGLISALGASVSPLESKTPTAADAAPTVNKDEETTPAGGWAA